MLRQINFEKGIISKVQFSLKNDKTHNDENEEGTDDQVEQEEGKSEEGKDEDEERAASQSFISSLLVHGNCILPITYYLLPPVYLIFNKPLSSYHSCFFWILILLISFYSFYSFSLSFPRWIFWYSDPVLRTSVLEASRHPYLLYGLKRDRREGQKQTRVLPPILDPPSLHFAPPPVTLPARSNNDDSRSDMSNENEDENDDDDDDGGGGGGSSTGEHSWARRQFSVLWAPMPSSYQKSKKVSTIPFHSTVLFFNILILNLLWGSSATDNVLNVSICQSL